MQSSLTRFVLDTDIGTDVDDLLALALAIGSPELEITAVTTVYGDVDLRARLVAHAFALAGVSAPPILPGLAETRSGRPVWWAGHEGQHLPATTELPSAEGLDPLEAMARARTIVAIAPLTNVAAALERPGHQVERVVMMGGEFRTGVVEHNIRCDVAAAEAVFRSGAPVVAVGLDQTERLRISEETLHRFADGSALGALIEAETRQFWSFAEQDSNVPHDPIALMALARPDLFRLTSGWVRVETSGAHTGRTTFEPDPDGPHQIVVDLEIDRLAEEIVTRLSRATARAATASPKETVQ